jgi:hypothetical protein
MPGGLIKQIREWIDEIPDKKLDGTFVEGRPIHIDRDCRFDVQGITTDEPKMLNLQVQVNNGCERTTMAKLKPKSVAWCLAPIEDPWTPREIKDALMESVTGFEVRPPRQKKGEDTKGKGKGKSKKK